MPAYAGMTQKARKNLKKQIPAEQRGLYKAEFAVINLLHASHREAKRFRFHHVAEAHRL